MRLKSIGIVVTMLLSLCLVINSSQAASISYMYVYANTDYGGGADFYAYLFADEDISYIDWYVKQTYPVDEADSDYEHVHTSMPNSGTQSVYEYLGLFDGHIKIAEYDIKAEVTFSDADGNESTDSMTTSTSVLKPVYPEDSGYQQTGVYGYSELTAHYFDGSSIVMDGFVWAYNGTGENATGYGKFRHTAINQSLDELEKPLPSRSFKPGETYGYSTGDWGTYFNFDTGGELQPGNEWECNAYLRLKVSLGEVDDWLAEDTNTFDVNDN